MSENGTAGGEPGDVGGIDGTASTRELVEKIKAHEAYAAKVKTAYSDLSDMYNRLRDDYAAFVTKHNESMNKAEHVREEHEEKIAELKDQLEDVKSQLDKQVVSSVAAGELQVKLTEAEKDLEETKDAMQRSSDQAQRAAEENDNLREQLAEMTGEINDLKQQLEDQEGNMNTTKTELCRLTDNLKGISLEEEEEADPRANTDVSGEDLMKLCEGLDALQAELRQKFILDKATIRSRLSNKAATAGEDAENPEQLLQELVRVKMELAETEESRLQLQQELREIRRTVLAFICKAWQDV